MRSQIVSGTARTRRRARSSRDAPGSIAAIPSLPRDLDVEFSDFGFYSELIAAAMGVSVARDNALVVSPPGADWFIWDRVPFDGVIVIEPVVGEPALPDLRRRRVPFVTVSADPAGAHADAVVRSDDRDGTSGCSTISRAPAPPRSR